MGCHFPCQCQLKLECVLVENVTRAESMTEISVIRLLFLSPSPELHNPGDFGLNFIRRFFFAVKCLPDVRSVSNDIHTHTLTTLAKATLKINSITQSIVQIRWFRRLCNTRAISVFQQFNIRFINYGIPWRSAAAYSWISFDSIVIQIGVLKRKQSSNNFEYFNLSSGSCSDDLFSLGWLCLSSRRCHTAIRSAIVDSTPGIFPS